MRKMQHFLQNTIGGILTDPMPDEEWVYLSPQASKAPMKKMNIIKMRFWHGICTNSNSQNFVDWRAI